MKNYVKGAIVGISIWVLLLLTFKISGSLINCTLPTNEFGEMIVGISCWNSIQNFVLAVLSILSFSFLFLGANPNLSTVGPNGVMLFWVGSAISLTLWGMLVGWIIGKIKSKRK